MKNVNKNNFRILLAGVIISGLIFGGIGVAAVTLTADQIKYTPSNEKFTVTNVKDAMDEIYKISAYEIPVDTYFYESGTEGDEATIVRYKKINDEYFVCDANGLVSEGTAATDITSKTLIPYTATTARNLSAGTAGYASNSFILGDGSDNAAYVEQITKEIYVVTHYGNLLQQTEGKVYQLLGQVIDVSSGNVKSTMGQYFYLQGELCTLSSRGYSSGTYSFTLTALKDCIGKFINTNKTISEISFHKGDTYNINVTNFYN